MTDDRKADKSRRILDRVSRESDPGQGLVARSADRVRGHLAADDADQSDRIEVLGTRIGRMIAFVLMGAFILWLVVYLAGASV